MKSKNLLLAIVMTFILSVVGMNLATKEAMANEGYTCVCNGEYYTSWVDAAEKLDSEGISGTIQMITDETMTCYANLSTDEITITLDLNGKNVNYPDCDEYTGVQINEGMTFILDDSVGTGTYSVGNDYYGMIFVAGGNFIMNGGTIITNENKATNEKAIYSNYGSTTINGGKIKTRFPFQLYGKFGTTYLNMTGGELIGETNCVITGDAIASISDGSIYCKNEDYPALVIGIWDYSGKGLWPRVTIKGGEFHNPDYAGIKIFSYANDETGACNFDNYLAYGYKFSDSTITDDGTSYLTAPYVKVSPIESTVTFDANGGIVKPDSKKVFYEREYGELPKAIRPAYIFDGWYTDKIAGEKVTEHTMFMEVKDVTLYAHWKEIPRLTEPTIEEPSVTNPTDEEIVKIEANKSNTKITGIRNKVYTGKKVTLNLKVVCNGKKLANGTDYTVKYSSNKKVGKAKVKITFKGNYTGEITESFNINPKSTNITKITSKKNKINVNWKKNKQADGYEFICSTSKKFKSKKVVSIKSNKTTKTTIKKLKSNKRYYVKIRTYKVVKGKKYYSAWSKVNSIRVK